MTNDILFIKFDSLYMYYNLLFIELPIGGQCLKLRVHPPPCVHILTAGYTDFITCTPCVLPTCMRSVHEIKP